MAAAVSEGEPARGGKKAAEEGGEAAEGGGAGGGGGGASPEEALADNDVSVGLPHWEQQRSAWVSGDRAASSSEAEEQGGGEKRPQQQQQQQQQRNRAGARSPVIDPDANYDDLLLTNEPFEVPIPLPEMVDFLVDTWIDDGLY